MCGVNTTSVEITTMFAKKLLWPNPEELARKYFLTVTFRDGSMYYMNTLPPQANNNNTLYTRSSITHLSNQHAHTTKYANTSH